MLTDKEKEELEKIKLGFNIIPEANDYNYLASRRVDVSRIWSKKLLRASLVLNIFSMVFILITFVIALLKPLPTYYASTPSGQIYGPLKKLNIKK